MLLRTAAALSATLLVIVTACGGASSTGGSRTEGASSNTTLPTTAPVVGETSDLGLPVIDAIDVADGDIGIAGSSTVFPLSTAVLTQWIDEGGPDYSIDSIGSGGGFERFCVEGASDIANASRPITDEEVASCGELDPPRVPIEIRIGTDALSVVVSSGNSFATELTIEEIATAFSLTDPDATWAEVNPAFPAHPIEMFSPGADSGTFDYFNEVVFDEADPSPILSSKANIVGEDDNVTVQGVAQDGCVEGDISTTCAIGYFGYAFLAENSDVLTPVAIDAGDGPVAPGDKSVDDNTYPLSRPLFMYTDAGLLESKPQVALFMAYYLNNVNDLIGDVGYFPAPADSLQISAHAIKEAAGW